MFSSLRFFSQQVASQRQVRANAEAGSVNYKDLMDIAEEACRRGEQVGGDQIFSNLPCNLERISDILDTSRSFVKLRTNLVRSLTKEQPIW